MIKNLSSYFKYIILYFKYNILITIGIKFIILDNYSYCHENVPLIVEIDKSPFRFHLKPPMYQEQGFSW